MFSIWQAAVLWCRPSSTRLTSSAQELSDSELAITREVGGHCVAVCVKPTHLNIVVCAAH